MIFIWGRSTKVKGVTYGISVVSKANKIEKVYRFRVKIIKKEKKNCVIIHCYIVCCIILRCQVFNYFILKT